MFFYIMLAVALFGALAFMVSRSMKGQQASTLSKQELNIIASEIIDRAQRLRDGVSRLRQRGVSESDICFYHPLQQDATNENYDDISTCGDNRYSLYHEDGGNVKFQPIPAKWLLDINTASAGFGEWMYINNTAVEGVGTGPVSATSALELMALIRYPKDSVCEAVNAKIGITGIPNNGNDFASGAPVSEGFNTVVGDLSVVDFNGKTFGCFYHDGTTRKYNVIYQVLIER